jgi:sec-independent protein translocase protein TatA
MGNLGATELLIIAVVIVLLFGSKKLPEMARSLGKSAKILKAETTGMRGEAEQAPQPAPTTMAAQATTVTAAALPPEAQQESEVDRMQKQIDDLQRQLKDIQQTPKNAG